MPQLFVFTEYCWLCQNLASHCFGGRKQSQRTAVDLHLPLTRAATGSSHGHSHGHGHGRVTCRRWPRQQQDARHGPTLRPDPFSSTRTHSMKESVSLGRGTAAETKCSLYGRRHRHVSLCLLQMWLPPANQSLLSLGSFPLCCSFTCRRLTAEPFCSLIASISSSAVLAS